MAKPRSFQQQMQTSLLLEKEEGPQPFKIELEDDTALVVEQTINGRRVFYAQFKSGKRPLVVAVAEDRQGTKFWTSIPEGRQQEAEIVGKAVATYIRSNR